MVREAGVLGECIAVNNVVEEMRQEDVSVESQRLQKTGVCLKLEIVLSKLNYIGINNEGI